MDCEGPGWPRVSGDIDAGGCEPRAWTIGTGGRGCVDEVHQAHLGSEHDRFCFQCRVRGRHLLGSGSRRLDGSEAAARGRTVARGTASDAALSETRTERTDRRAEKVL